MKVSSLIDNVGDSEGHLCHEHGLSLHIKTGERSILFDTGRTGTFLQNAKKLGVDVGKIDTVVISHGHADHAGGLLSFFQENARAVVYMKKGADGDFFARFCGVKKYIGIDKEVFSRHGNRIRFIEKTTEIGDGVFLVTGIDITDETPRGNRCLLEKRGNQLARDTFAHEQILVIRENEHLHVFSGCSHNGISNIIGTVRKVFPGEKIGTLCGGFHLMRSTRVKWLPPLSKEIAVVSKALRDDAIDKIYTGHCTGELAFARLRHDLGNKIDYLRTGMTLTL